MKHSIHKLNSLRREREGKNAFECNKLQRVLTCWKEMSHQMHQSDRYRALDAGQLTEGIIGHGVLYHEILNFTVKLSSSDIYPMNPELPPTIEYYPIPRRKNENVNIREKGPRNEGKNYEYGVSPGEKVLTTIPNGMYYGKSCVPPCRNSISRSPASALSVQCYRIRI